MVLLGRLRRELGGRSFAGFLVSAREVEGGGSNHVAGPDFVWRPYDGNSVSGQLLVSRSELPRRPDLTLEWDGRRLLGAAAQVRWDRIAAKWDGTLEAKSFGEGFRADNGFVPQTGYFEGIGQFAFRIWRDGKALNLALCQLSYAHRVWMRRMRGLGGGKGDQGPT